MWLSEVCNTTVQFLISQLYILLVKCGEKDAIKYYWKVIVLWLQKQNTCQPFFLMGQTHQSALCKQENLETANIK